MTEKSGLQKNIEDGNKLMKRYCVFPDQTEIELHPTLSLIEIQDEQVHIAYLDEVAGVQSLWVPKEFITTK